MRKAQVESTIIFVLLGIAGFMIISGLIGQWFSRAEGPMAEQICRGSVAAKIALDPKEELGKNFPLLCNTQQIDLVPPKGKKLEEQKEYLKKMFADMMVRCWDEFGQGASPDIFERTEFGSKECFICYAVSVKGLTEKDNFGSEKGHMVSASDMNDYLRATAHSAQVEGRPCYQGGGQCIVDTAAGCPNEFPTLKDACPDWDGNGVKNKCCINTKSGCENKGGKCAKEIPSGYNEYKHDLWDCPKDEKCYVKNNNYVSLLHYLQYSGGAANIVLTDIEPAETYAVAVGFPSTAASSFWNAAVGTGAVLGSLVLLTKAPVAGGLVSATVNTVGLKAVVFAGGVAGWVTAPGDKGYQIYDIIRGRAYNTIYLTKLGTPNANDPNSLQQYCHFNPGVGES